MDLERLSFEEENQIVEKNINLVRHLVYNKLRLTGEDADDAIQIGCIGLIKAVSTYSSSKKTKLSTYASRCIINEIYMAFRKEKRHLAVIKLEDVLGNTDDESNLTYIDILSKKNSCQYEVMENRETVERAVNFILNLLDSLSKVVMLYIMSGMTQQAIAKKICVSRSYISRIVSKSRERLSSYLNNDSVSEENRFKMSILGDQFFQITIKTESKHKFNEALARVLVKMGEEEEKVPMFTITKRGEKINILLIIDSKSFEFLGEIIQEIEKN